MKPIIKYCLIFLMASVINIIVFYIMFNYVFNSEIDILKTIINSVVGAIAITVIFGIFLKKLNH